ncbi:MAG: hypothetical protein LAC69_04860 [Chlorobium sp.]|jgi:hypothetical protein|nr:hypothetical protein [Chlorobium sp.]
MEIRHYQNYIASFVFEAIGDEDRAGVIDLWRRTQALPPGELAERRVTEIVIVVRESLSGIVVAVNSVFRAKLNPESPDYYVFRSFIDPAHRGSRLIAFMTRFAYEALNQMHRPGGPAGLFFFTDNKKLQRPCIMERIKQEGFEYLGRGPLGRDKWCKLFV